MQSLGHPNITDPPRCIHLKEALFKRECEDYLCKVASTMDEAKALIEADFECVCAFNDVKAVQKRK